MICRLALESAGPSVDTVGNTGVFVWAKGSRVGQLFFGISSGSKMPEFGFSATHKRRKPIPAR